GAAVDDRDPGDLDVLADPDAARPRAPGERRRDVGGVGLAVAGDPDRAGQIVGAHQRPAPGRLAEADLLRLDAEAPRHGGGALELDQALRGVRHREAPATLPPGGLSGLRLERGVELRAVADELRHVGGGAKLADEARRVPRGAARERPALEQDDVAPAEAGQVIGGAAADDAAADDDGPRVGGQAGGHAVRPATATGPHSVTPNSCSVTRIAPSAPCISASPSRPMHPTRKLSATMSLPG